MIYCSGIWNPYCDRLEKSELRAEVERTRARERRKYVHLSEARWGSSTVSAQIKGLLNEQGVYFIDTIKEFAPLQRFFERALHVPETALVSDFETLLTNLKAKWIEKGWKRGRDLYHSL